MDLFLELSPAEDSNESPHCSLDNNIAHILNLLDSPSEQPRSGDTVSDYNDDVPDTQPIRAQILKGVVAYVEARSGNDNRSSAISRELELLGATVEKKLTNDVTHVVFKAGRKVTQERARKRGIHLVSVLWVDSCKQNLRHMSESMFPVMPSETLRTPVFVGRLKKCKSMQPKDFDDDVASSADRGQKRRRRQAHADKWKVLETPGAGLLLGAAHAYVEETQPRSPTDTTPLPFNLTVPDTPPSMREKLDSLRRKRLSLQLTAGMGKPQCGGTAQSSPTQVNEPLQRRLFSIPQYDISPQPCVATPEIETPKDVSGDLIKTNANSPVGQEAEEEDPLPVRLLGSSTICIPNRRHRLLPLNQEPSTELLQPVYTDQCRRPGQNHFFPEIASQKPKKTKQKCAVKRTERTSNEDTVKLPPRKKGNSTKSGKRKNGSLRKSNTPEEDKLCKRRRKGSGEETERGGSVASLRGAVQDVDGATCGNVATTSSHVDRQKSDGSHATGSREKAKVLDVNDNDVCNTPESGVRLQDVLPCSRVAADSRRPGVKICDMSLQTNSLTNLSKSSGAATVELSSTQETCTTGTRHTNKKCSARLPTIDMQSSANILTARCRRSVANELRLSNGVNEERTVARRRSVRLQQNEPHKPNCDTVNRARQSVRDCLASTNTDLSASNLSAMNRSTATQLSLTSSMLQNSQFLNLARSSRKSIDEFAIACQRRPSAKKNTPCNNSTVSSVNRSKSVGIHSNKNNSEVVQPNTSHKLGSSSYCRGNSNISGGDVCDTSNWKKIVIAENRKSHEHPSKTLVMTSLHTDEQDMVRSVVKKLGGYRIASSVCETTTHVICGNDRRTINVLLGICRGSWLLSLEWVFKSLECNRWLEEEPYEHSDFFPAAQISRLERLTGSGNYTQDLFSKHSPICITPHTVPSRTDLMKLIRLCAGQVTQCLAKCRVCIGKVPQQPGVISVSEQWVLDSITAHRALPHKMYTLNSAGDSARGDSSPEY